MKKKILLLWFLGLTLNLQADEVPLDRKSHSDVSQSEIPINVDIDKSLLSINFLKANKTFVTILGPDAYFGDTHPAISVISTQFVFP